MDIVESFNKNCGDKKTCSDSLYKSKEPIYDFAQCDDTHIVILKSDCAIILDQYTL